MPLDRLSAGWRRGYVERATAVRRDGRRGAACVFCGWPTEPIDVRTGVVELAELTLRRAQRLPLRLGARLVLPRRHVAAIGELTEEESAALWASGHEGASRRSRRRTSPTGRTSGRTSAAAGGAGIPGHLHLHVLPRWDGDTNFMTSVAETRVLPEDLDDTYVKLHEAFAATR